MNGGGTCFDLTNPPTRKYVRSMARRIGQECGYKYFTLDGRWTGTASAIRYINTGCKDDHLGESTLHDPGVTHIQAYRDGLKLLREAAGDGVFLLGCNVAQNIQLIGLAFVDDSVITDIIGRRRRLGGTFDLSRVSPVLIEGFEFGGEFVYGHVADAPSQEQLI